MSADKKIAFLEKELARKDKRINQLVNLCNEKDRFFSELASDAMRHGSSLGAMHMADKKHYMNSKK